ncbi:MAG TPA: cytochrome C oxidase subunit II [Myxococcota bacterium]|nr:cytochrome C oxidase subunit II [Myxococcota bacterium]
MILNYLGPSASTYAGQIDFLFDVIFVLVGIPFLIASGLFFYFILRFKKKDGQPGMYITGEEHEYKKWIHRAHVPILVFDVVIVVIAVNVWYTIKQDLPEQESTIRVVAQQWAWTFEHPGPDNVLGTADDIPTVNELRVAKDTLYHFKLESLDVLHNFSVPAFRLKQDAIPGRVITGWFEPTQEGEFDIQCAEICGIGHGLMPARIVIESKEQHAAWVAENSPLSLAAHVPAGPTSPVAKP